MKKTFTFFALFVCVFFSVSVFAAQLEEKIDLNQVTLMGNCNYSDLEHSALLGIPDGKSHTFAGVSLLNIDKLKGKGTCVLGVRVFIGDAVESGKVFLGSDYLSPEVEKSFEYKIGGWQYVLFDQPYDYKEDIYVGFEATGKTDFLALESAKKTIKTEMMYIDGTWDLVNNQVGRYVWAIQAIVVGGDYSSERQHDVVLERAAVSKNPKVGDPITVSCEVRGAGIVPAENVLVKCSLGSETKTVNVSEKLMNGQSLVVNFEGFTAPAIDGAFGDVNVELIAEYSDDTDAKNNDSEASVRVYSADATERVAILAEQFTGQPGVYVPVKEKRLSRLGKSVFSKVLKSDGTSNLA